MQHGVFALARMVAAWALGAVVAHLALDRLFGVPRLVVIAAAVAIPMFVNDTANIDPLFPRARRVWLASGLVRGAIALIGTFTILYLVLWPGYRSIHFGAVIAGLAVGGLAGTITREARAALKARRQGGRK
jgi:CubicO group peptidase (beta-lactamase class C family)